MNQDFDLLPIIQHTRGVVRRRLVRITVGSTKIASFLISLSISMDIMTICDIQAYGLG